MAPLPNPTAAPLRSRGPRNCEVACSACLLARRKFAVAGCAFCDLCEPRAVRVNGEEPPAVALETVEEDERPVRRPLGLAVYLTIVGHRPLIAAVSAHDLDVPHTGDAARVGLLEPGDLLSIRREIGIVVAQRIARKALRVAAARRHRVDLVVLLEADRVRAADEEDRRPIARPRRVDIRAAAVRDLL